MKNYDKDIQWDILMQGFGSLRMMTLELIMPNGLTIKSEAVHGTIMWLYHKYQKGREMLMNPVALIFVWTCGLLHSTSLDENKKLKVFMKTSLDSQLSSTPTHLSSTSSLVGYYCFFWVGRFIAMSALHPHSFFCFFFLSILSTPQLSFIFIWPHCHQKHWWFIALVGCPLMRSWTMLIQLCLALLWCGCVQIPCECYVLGRIRQ